MNLSETAFITTTSDPSKFGLRWFTPTAEVALCGHATIASTAFLSNHPKHGSASAYNFNTLSGVLVCKKIPLEDGGESYELDFPEDVPTDQIDQSLLESKHVALKAALGENFGRVKKIWKGKFDTVVEVEVPAGEHLGDWAVNIAAIVSLMYDLVSRSSPAWPCTRALSMQEESASRPCCHHPRLPLSHLSTRGSLHLR